MEQFISGLYWNTKVDNTDNMFAVLVYRMTLSGVVEAVKTVLMFVSFPLFPPFLFPLWQSQHEIPRELCSVDKYREEEGES